MARNIGSLFRKIGRGISHSSRQAFNHVRRGKYLKRVIGNPILKKIGKTAFNEGKKVAKDVAKGQLNHLKKGEFDKINPIKATGDRVVKGLNNVGKSLVNDTANGARGLANKHLSGTGKDIANGLIDSGQKFANSKVDQGTSLVGAKVNSKLNKTPMGAPPKALGQPVKQKKFTESQFNSAMSKKGIKDPQQIAAMRRHLKSKSHM